MDDVFNSGLPAWKTHKKKSRLDELENEIATGNLKVARPHGAIETQDVAHETEKKGAGAV